MNPSLAYAFGALLCFGLSDFVYKRASVAGVRADHLLMTQAWIVFPLFLLNALVTRSLAFVPAALWGAVAGVFVFIGFYCFLRSLASGSVSVNGSIFRLNFIVTVLLAAVWLGEPLTPAKLAGLALAGLATWLLVGAENGRGRSAGPARQGTRSSSWIQVTVATLAFGASNFFHAVGLRRGAGPETLAVAQAALFVPLATGTVLLADRALLPPLAVFRYSAVTAVVLFSATIFLLHSVAGGQASVMVPITQMGFIVSASLGIAVLRERVTLRKAVGLASALGALAALALG